MLCDNRPSCRTSALASSAMADQGAQPIDPHARHSATPGELVEFNALERTGVAFLSWRDADGKLRLRSLGDAGERPSIGRSPASTILLDWDPTVSWVHAELECRAGEWYVVDDRASTNGTYVNGDLVDGRKRLVSEDRVRVGSNLIVFHAPSAHTPARKTTVATVVVQRGDLDQLELAVLIATCCPCVADRRAEPATTEAIARSVHLGRDAVRRRLGRLYVRFEIAHLEQGTKKRRLVDLALDSGLVSRRDCAP